LRIALALILLAAAGGVIYLLMEDRGDGGGRSSNTERPRIPDRPDNGGHGDPGGASGGAALLPNIAKTVRAQPSGHVTQEAVAEFVAECRRRGPEAVPLLLRELQTQEDVPMQPRWVFRDKRLVGFPTLRSAYLSGLAAIPGADADLALREVLRTARSPEESYFLALALQERELAGWAGDLLRRAFEPGKPATLPLRRDMVALATESDPKGAADRLVRDIPRGDSKADGRLMGEAAKLLPVDIAIETTRSLLIDAEVTYRAKGTLVRALLSRPEPQVYESFREEALRGTMDEPMKIAISYAAANNPNFFQDAAAYQVASAGGDTAKADAIRRRFESRLRAAEELINATLNLDVTTSTDKRAASLRRILQAHKSKLDPPR
jgi:hypothetical protein